MKLLASVVATTFAVQSNNLCPSYDPAFDPSSNDGCYQQQGTWVQNGSPNAIRCKMTNSDCLNVTCGVDRLQAEFRGDLFDSNPGQAKFLQQIASGTRAVLDKHGNAINPSGPCGFAVGTGSFAGKSLKIDWPYAACSHLMNINLVGQEITYSVSLSIPGDDLTKPIEFYVDHKMQADCKYPTEIVLDNQQFWVNQEDVAASGADTGELAGEFTCDFYSDPARQQPINSDNIVNMGDTIYGQVTSNPLFGLSYELTQVTVSDFNNNALSFNVIENAGPVAAVSSTVEDQQATGGPLNFDWMSFGFQGKFDQNKLDIQCHVDLKLNPDTRCPTGFEIVELQDGDQCVQVNKGKFQWETAKSTCQDASTDLALPTNENDNRVFAKLVGFGKYDLWIGGEYDEDQKKWVNANDGSDIAWFNWNNGEPNNWRGDEFMLHIILTDTDANGYEKKNGKWNDHYSHNRPDEPDRAVSYGENNAFICITAPAF